MRLIERLKGSGFEVVGGEGSSYSFDIIAAKEGSSFAIKVVENPMHERVKEYVPDLKRISVPLDLTPLLVCDEGPPDDMLITLEGVPSITSTTLLKLAGRGEKPPFVYASRGGVYVKVRGGYIRRQRLERGMSLGDLSLLLGVTRRMVYEYETGRSDVTAEVAERLIRVFGDEVLERMTLNSIKEHFKRSRAAEQPPASKIRDPTLKRIHSKLLKAGFIGLAIERAPFHLAAKKECEGVSTKLVIRKSREGREFEEQLTLEVAKLCKSYVLLVTEEKFKLVGEHVAESSVEDLENYLGETLPL